jgi:predicted DsbA family dithiol-disulfide isomerase
LAKDLDFSVDRRPYLLSPDKPPEGEPRNMHEGETETEVTPAMQERASGVGLAIHRPQWSPNTLMGPEATIHATEQGLDTLVPPAAAGAYWAHGADLGKIAVVRELAEKSGLDWSSLGPLLDSGHYRPKVMEESQAARARGVTGTPTYLIAGELHGGDISIEELRSSIEAAS